MGVHTTATTQQEGREGGPRKFVQFSFERDQVVIDHYAPARYRLRLIFTIERHDDDEHGPAARPRRLARHEGREGPPVSWRRPGERGSDGEGRPGPRGRGPPNP